MTRFRTRGTRMVCALSLLFWLAPSQALAQQPAEPTGEELSGGEPEVTSGEGSSYDELVASASDHFANKRYEKALADLEAAYDIEPNPNLLYNQARIHEAMGNLERALELYETFAVAPDIDLEYRKETLERIKVLKEAVALKDDGKKSDAEKTTDTEVAVTTPPPATTSEPRRSPIGGILLVTGGMSLAAGGVFAGLAVTNHNNFQDSTDLEEKRGFGDRVDTFSLAADGLFLAGGLLVAGGLITLAVTRDRAESPRALRITPAASRDGAGAMMQFSF